MTSAYDHNYTNNIIIPDMNQVRHSNWSYIHDVEHNYCGQSLIHSKQRDISSTLSLIHTEHSYNNVFKQSYDVPSPTHSVTSPSNVSNNSDHNYHLSQGAVNRRHRCLMCGQVYVYKFNLERHALSCRGAPGVVYRMCDMRFKSYKELYVHRTRDHPIDDPSNLQKEPWGSENEAPWFGMEDTS